MFHIYVNNIVTNIFPRTSFGVAQTPISCLYDAKAHLQRRVIPTRATVGVMAPRYEYRVWAQDLAELHARLKKQCEPLSVRVSAEIYLVFGADVNVKIRSEILDVKEILRTEQGFQLWTPTLKEAFPLAAATVRDVLRLAGPNPPTFRVEYLEMADFLALAKEAGAVVTAVSKRRSGYSHEGCLLEFAEVNVEGSGLHTVAVESEDLDTAIEVVAQMGIDGLPNRSYPVALRQALGM